MKTVLIVDDEFGNVDVLAVALEDEGYRVFTAPNGRRALERMAENRPDLVISDLMMPLMDGAAFATAIRSDDNYREIPIIMMSSVSEVAVRQRFDTYQAFLRKPFQLATFLEAVRAALGEPPLQSQSDPP